MTDNEIIKALECCFVNRACLDCPLDTNSTDSTCLKRLRNEAVQLCLRQKAEIERYKGVIKLLEKDVKDAKNEGIKEYSDFLIDKSVKGVIYAMDIPDYYQEMVGD